MAEKEEIQCCTDCKNCINTDLAYCCACVFKIDVVTGKRIYEPCESARNCINRNGYGDKCEFFKKRVTFFERLKSLFTSNG